MRSVVGDVSAFGGLLSVFPGGMAYRFLAKAFDGHLFLLLCVCPNSCISRFDLGSVLDFNDCLTDWDAAEGFSPEWTSLPASNPRHLKQAIRADYHDRDLWRL
jgi:hypothetical protein